MSSKREMTKMETKKQTKTWDEQQEEKRKIKEFQQDQVRESLVQEDLDISKLKISRTKQEAALDYSVPKHIPFKPLFRYILIKKIVPKERTSAGGIILTEGKESKLSHTNKGILAALGSKAFEYELQENRPKKGTIIHFTRYEDFAIDHSTEQLEGEYCMVYDEYVTAVEL